MKCFSRQKRESENKRQHRNDVDLFSLIKAIAKRMEFNDVVDIALRVSALNHSCILNDSAATVLSVLFLKYTFSCL